MFKAAVLSVLGWVAGMSGTVANAQFFYSPVGYSYSGYYPVRPVYSSPIVVGLAPRYYAAPVVLARPVFVSPVVQTVYSAPVYPEPTYASPISTVSYQSEPTPVYSEPATSYYAPAPVYVTAAPVVVSRAIYAPAYGYESLRVGLHSSTYRARGYGYSVYERSTPHRTVTRVRGW
jgi:hypothetical protein